MLRSDLSDDSDSHIVVEGDITIEGANNRDSKNRSLTFKNNAPFISYISKINSVLIENAEGLNAVMPIYNLIEYSKNYTKRSGSLWSYYRDEPNNPPINFVTNLPTVEYDADPVTNSAPFKYKSSIIEKNTKQ